MMAHSQVSAELQHYDKVLGPFKSTVLEQRNLILALDIDPWGLELEPKLYFS